MILSPRGELTVVEAPRLRTDLLAAIRDAPDEPIVVDLGQVTFVDAAAVGVLIAARERLAQEDRDLVVVAPSPQVRRTLELTGLDKVVRVVATLEELDGG